MKSWLRTLAPLASLILLAPALAAEVLPLRFGTTPELEQFWPSQSVAPLPGGGFAAIWSVRNPSGGGADVRMQWVRPDGSKVFGPQGLVVAGSREVEEQPVVVPHPESGVFVSFVRYGREGGRVLAQWFDGSGRRRWPGQGVTAAPLPLSGNQSMQHLASDGEGGLFLCFVRESGPQGGYDIGCQHIDAEGRRLWTKRGLEAGGIPGIKTVPHLLPDGEGGVFAFWRNLRLPFSRPDLPSLIEGQRFAADGTRLWGETGRLLHTTRMKGESSYSIPPTGVVPDGQGGAVIVFEDLLSGDDPNQDRDVIAQRVDRDGRPLWGSGAVVAEGPRSQSFEDAVPGPGGSLFVSVAEHFTGVGLLSRVYHLDRDGRPLWPDGIPLAEPTGGPQTDWNAFLSFDGELLRVVWEHYPDRASNSAFSQVRLAVFDLDGRRLNGPEGIALSGASSWNAPTGFVHDPVSGEHLAVWTRFWGSGFQYLNTMGALVDGIIPPP